MGQPWNIVLGHILGGNALGDVVVSTVGMCCCMWKASMLSPKPKLEKNEATKASICDKVLM